MSKLGFTEDREGLCVLLVLLKAGGKSIRLEEAFTSWWHVGISDLAFAYPVRGDLDQSNQKVLVVFGSLGLGIA